jgi:catechol 2,3-dioxygenase-like lactoylglutathione lyase family enzyme
MWLALVLLATPPVAASPTPALGRPRVLGISHVALRVSDLAAARSFYEGFLGLRVGSPPARTTEVAGPAVLVNPRQYVELRPGLQPDQDRLDHIALQTDDAEAMRRYLASRGVAVPERVRVGDDDSRRFSVRDPEGHAVELVQYPVGLPASDGSVSGVPVSRRILHLGIIVGDLAAAARFYDGVLGFSETWRGSRSGTELSWVNVKVPDGDDYLEFMLYGERPAPNARGTQHHICLEVPDVEKARLLLEARPSRPAYPRLLEVRVGTNRKRQLNLYDPDGTRVELMEPATVDDRPAPSSTAAPPRRDLR